MQFAFESCGREQKHSRQMAGSPVTAAISHRGEVLNKVISSGVVASILIATGLVSTVAQAQSESASPFSGNVSITSDYRFRGISQNNLNPAVQGGFDYEAGPFYLGTWASNVSWLTDGSSTVSNSVEMDFYGGYKGSAGGIDYDVGALYYYYPGEFPGDFNSPDTLELYAGGSWNGFSLKYSYAATDLFGFDDSDGAGYIDLGYEMELGSYTIGAHIGNQQIPSAAGRSSSDCSYTDWSLSGGTSLAGFDLSLAYIDTNAKTGAGECYRNAFNEELGKGTVVFTIGRSL